MKQEGHYSITRLFGIVRRAGDRRRILSDRDHDRGLPGGRLSAVERPGLQHRVACSRAVRLRCEQGIRANRPEDRRCKPRDLPTRPDIAAQRHMRMERTPVRPVAPGVQNRSQAADEPQQGFGRRARNDADQSASLAKCELLQTEREQTVSTGRKLAKTIQMIGCYGAEKGDRQMNIVSRDPPAVSAFVKPSLQVLDLVTDRWIRAKREEQPPRRQRPLSVQGRRQSRAAPGRRRSAGPCGGLRAAAPGWFAPPRLPDSTRRSTPDRRVCRSFPPRVRQCR